MIAILRQIHAWAGAILCLGLMVMGLSGSALVFKDDLLRALIPDAATKAEADPVALAAITQTIETQLQNKGLRSVVFGGDGVNLHRVSLQDGQALHLTADGAPLIGHHQVLSAWDWLFELHHEMLAGDIGEVVVGSLGLSAIALVLSGIYLTLPTLRLFAPRLLPRSGKRAHLLWVHRDLGLLLAPFMVALAATGAMIVFADQSKPMFQALAPGPMIPKPPQVGVGTVNWQSALTAAQARFPQATLRIVIWPNKPNQPITVRLRQHGEWHTNGRTIVWIDPATSAVAGRLDAQKLGTGDRAWNALWPLHAAKTGVGFSARLVDIATALTGLGLAALSAYGLMAFLKGRIFGLKLKRALPNRAQLRSSSDGRRG